MEPTNKSSIKKPKDSNEGKDTTVIEFLPDADEIERSPFSFFARFTLYFLVFSFASFIVWAMYADVNRVVVARGKLVTSSTNIIVQPLETSIIKSLDVRSGQIVKKGQQLATLDSTFAEADKEQLRTKLSSLETQTQRLISELSGNKGIMKVDTTTDSQLQTQLSAERKGNLSAQLKKLAATIARLRSAMQTNRRDQRVMSSRVKVLREMESMKAKLVEQQSLAKVSLLEARDRRFQVEREMQFAKNRENELKSELALALAEEEVFRKDWRQKTMEELLSVSRERDALREQLQKADKRRKMVILTSPFDAIVLKIAKLSQGSVVRAAETLFTLVPLDSKLEAEVQINAVDIGYVKIGSEVQLKFDAFPFQHHGAMDGKIRTISEGAFQHDASTQGSGAYYLGKVRLGDKRLKKMTKGGRLMPGMTLKSEILVGKHSVISYLVWPLTKSLD